MQGKSKSKINSKTKWKWYAYGTDGLLSLYRNTGRPTLLLLLSLKYKIRPWFGHGQKLDAFTLMWLNESNEIIYSRSSPLGWVGLWYASPLSQAAELELLNVLTKGRDRSPHPCSSDWIYIRFAFAKY